MSSDTIRQPMTSEDSEEESLRTERKRITSAHLIAGVRAHTSGALFEDPYAERVAGEEGMAMAAQVLNFAPRLGVMITARTAHGDRTVRAFVDAGGRDIIVLGTGWDMRPFRMSLPAGVTFYEADFATFLDERNRRLAELSITPPAGVSRIMVPIDLRTQRVDVVFREHLSADRPVLVIWEGVAPYLILEHVEHTVKSIGRILGHPDSRLWLDLVSEEAVMHPEHFTEAVQSFMNRIRQMGEPFRSGVSDVASFMDGQGYVCEEIVDIVDVVEGADDPVYEIYQLCVAKTKR